MRKWKDDLLPVLLEMMQDSTAVVKREVCITCNDVRMFMNSYFNVIAKLADDNVYYFQFFQ